MTIPVVQGVAVPNPAAGGYAPPSDQPQQLETPYYGSNAAATGSSGAQQPSNFTSDGYIYSHDELKDIRQDPTSRHKYQDVAWAMAFYAQLVIVLGLCVYMFSTGNGVMGGSSVVSLGSLVFVAGICGVVAVALSALSLQWMMNHTETLVQTALVFSICTSLAVGILGFLVGNVLMGVLAIASFGIGICYAVVVWARIPFAAANLKTAVTAVRDNMGLTAVALGFCAVAFGWSLIWFLGLGNALSGTSLFLLFLLLLSYYWTHQVLVNTVHVTAAGVIGTWWFVPEEANAWWSPALTDSLHRATTYSFGSICFGSFLVAFVQALRTLEQYARNNDDCSALVCLIQCILACIQAIVEFLNRWAYVYVALYGFDYLTAGRNVIQLFQQKGWTVIIADDLAENVLFMMSVGVGLASGLVGLLLGMTDANLFASLGVGDSAGPAFFVGLLVGFTISSIMLNVVSSAVNTVIVSYAEAPAEFQSNHPELSGEMRAAWVQAWPGIVT